MALISDIRAQLRREGYDETALDGGPSLHSQLRNLSEKLDDGSARHQPADCAGHSVSDPARTEREGKGEGRPDRAGRRHVPLAGAGPAHRCGRDRHRGFAPERRPYREDRRRHQIRRPASRPISARNPCLRSLRRPRSPRRSPARSIVSPITPWARLANVDPRSSNPSYAYALEPARPNSPGEQLEKVRSALMARFDSRPYAGAGLTSCLNTKVHSRRELFILVCLDVDAVAVFAPDEGAALMRSVVHGFGWGSVTRSPQRFRPPTLVQVPAAQPKNAAPCEVRAPCERNPPEFGKGLCGLSGCGTSTNVFIAAYRRHD